jgi:23S rRNA-/tRNA-specific pseudouridylate synthase
VQRFHVGRVMVVSLKVKTGGARLLTSRIRVVNPAREDARPTESYSATPHPTTRTLVEAHPLTGRTHQIRIHLAKSGFPIVGDDLYGRRDDKAALGLRAVSLAYIDPFTRRRVGVVAPTVEFCREYGFPEISVTDKSPS